MTNTCVGRLAICAGFLTPSRLSATLSIQIFSPQLLSQFYPSFTFTSVLTTCTMLIWVEYTEERLICNTWAIIKPSPWLDNWIVKCCQVFVHHLFYSPFSQIETYWRVKGESTFVPMASTCRAMQPPSSFLPVRWLLPPTPVSTLSSPFSSPRSYLLLYFNSLV